MAARGARAAAGKAGHGIVSAGSSDTSLAAAFREGLNEAGYFEGQNVTVEYHWLEGNFDRLRALMADLVVVVTIIATPAGALLPRRPKLRPRRSRSYSAWVPGQAGSCRQPCPAGRKPDRINFFANEYVRSGWRSARVGAQGGSHCRAGQSGQCPVTEACETSGSRTCNGTANQVLNASTSREIEAAFAAMLRDRAEALWVTGDFLHQPARPICDVCGELWTSSAFPLARVSKPVG